MIRFTCKQSLFIIVMFVLALPVSATEITESAFNLGVVGLRGDKYDSARSQLFHGAIGAPGVVSFGASAGPPSFYSTRPYYTHGIALFDLGGIDRRISSGNLRLNVGENPLWNNNNQATETVAVYDVGTNLQEIVSVLSTAPWEYGSSQTGAFLRDLFFDMESGAYYGNTQITAADRSGVVSIPLTAQAVDDLNTAAGTVMGIGFTMASPWGGVGIDVVTLAVNPFGDPVDGGGGLDFSLDDADVTGDGTVDLTPLGVRHHLNAYAGGAQTIDQPFSEVQRRFYFESDSPDPVSVRLSADLNGQLFVNQGSASVDSMISLYDRFGNLIDTASYFEDLSGTGALDLNETFALEVDLVPDEIYEIVSRIDLTASIFSPTGGASALFGDTFDIQLSRAGAIPPNNDLDGDGYTTEEDCDDNDPAVNPGAAEVCNGIDDDCDGIVDEGFDVDGDGYTTCGGDCDDADPAVNPGAAEVCNGGDDDCDGLVDEGFDADGDGYTTCGGDCDDVDPAVNPGAAEVCNGIDDECDGIVDEGFDVDGDGICNLGALCVGSSVCLGEDLCPDTVSDDPVDAAGCSDAQVDADGDGVCAPGAQGVGPGGCAGVDWCGEAPPGDFESFQDCRDTLVGENCPVGRRGREASCVQAQVDACFPGCQADPPPPPPRGR